MSYFVVLPGALVPASIAPPLLARAQTPLLARRLQRAQPEAPRHLHVDGAAHLAWLWRGFGGTGDPPVTAPYAWRALNRASAIDVASELPLWHADPVHFAFARDHMLLTALDGEAALTADESGALAAEAAAVAAEFDATLRVIDTHHWFLSFDPAWPLKAVAYDAALGRSAQHVLPEGDAAARWRKLLTELQIRWFHHPVNERREADGMRTVNGLWLHGGGLWQALPKRPFEAIASDDATIRGWALASGLAPSALLAASAKPAAGPSVLVYLPDLLRPCSHEDWDAWLGVLATCDAEIEAHVTHAFAHGYRDVTLVLAGREIVRPLVVSTSDRLKVWRRQKMADLFAEPEAA